MRGIGLEVTWTHEMGAWPELRYSQAVIIFALSNLLGTWQADCQREARAKHKARQTS